MFIIWLFIPERTSVPFSKSDTSFSFKDIFQTPGTLVSSCILVRSLYSLQNDMGPENKASCQLNDLVADLLIYFKVTYPYTAGCYISFCVYSSTCTCISQLNEWKYHQDSVFTYEEIPTSE